MKIILLFLENILYNIVLLYLNMYKDRLTSYGRQTSLKLFNVNHIEKSYVLN